MFGWFSPKQPIATSEKVWTERRMRWLAENLGIDRLRKATVVTPTDHFFPGKYEGSERDTRRMMGQLCRHMDIDAHALRLSIVEDERMPGAAGLYQRGRHERSHIRVARGQLAKPESLLATLAHELAHEILLGGDLISEGEEDHEQVTDLLPVFLGVGIFAANSTVQSAAWHAGTMEWFQIGRQGYLPSRVFGYAMALFAAARGEWNPAWASHLRPDARTPLLGGLRYLHKARDSLFDPDRIDPRGTEAAPVAILCRRLAEGTPTVRLSALWDLREHGEDGAEAVPQVAALLRHADDDLACNAAYTLPLLGPMAKSAANELRRATRHRSPATRAAAAAALGEFQIPSNEVVGDLADLLHDQDPGVVEQAARALAGYELRAEPCVPRLLALLEDSLVRCNDAQTALVAATLRAVASDPVKAIRERFANHDRELYRMALEAMGESGGKGKKRR